MKAYIGVVLFIAGLTMTIEEIHLINDKNANITAWIIASGVILIWISLQNKWK